MTRNGEWNTKAKKIQQEYSWWALGPEATHQITKSDYRTDSDNIELDKLLKLYNRYYLPERNEYNSRGDFFWAEQTDTGTPRNKWDNYSS